MRSHNDASNYTGELKSIATSATTVAEFKKDRQVLTLWNNDTTNFVTIYFDGSPTAGIPIAAGTGLDMKPAPMNKVMGIADTASINLTVWEG